MMRLKMMAMMMMEEEFLADNAGDNSDQKKFINMKQSAKKFFVPKEKNLI